MSVCLLTVLLLNACASGPWHESPGVVVKKTPLAIRIDGILEEGWNISNVYEFTVAREAYRNSHPKIRRHYEDRVVMRGNIRILWDEDYLYVSGELMDEDLVVRGEGDQRLHCNTGDVFEVFLKPENGSWYWELYGNPLGDKTAMFYPGRGHHSLPGILSPNSPLPGMKCAAKCRGTVNRSDDHDSGWTVEMAIPRKELSAKGIAFAPGVSWRVLFGRYDYSRWQLLRELSSFPQLRFFDFHSHEEYSHLVFQN